MPDRKITIPLNHEQSIENEYDNGKPGMLLAQVLEK